MALVKRSAPVTTPSGFIAAKNGHKTCELVQKQQLYDTQNGSISQAMMHEVFGSLLGPNDGPHDYTDPLYLQSINLQAAYDFKVVPFFGDVVTAQVLNNRANFLSTHVCPIWETNEQNFTVNRKEFNSVPFTQISELGVPDEQTHFSYSWNDSMEKVAMNARISRDLALDDNFGAEAWTDELAQFSSNASLTVNINIIYSYLDNGWKNISGNVARGEINTDPQRLLMREAEGFMIFPRDSVRGFAMIRNFEDSMPELDTVIGPGGFMQYLRDLQGESMTVPSVRPWSNPDVQGLMLDIYDGPDSFKSFALGNRRVNCFELHPLMVNLKTQRKFQPLTTKATLGQFHPPNPNVTAHDAVLSNNPDQLDTYLFYQTKSIGEERKITMRQRIENCQYWDKKTRRCSQLALDYVQHLDATKTDENTPWPWNRRNPKHAENAGDINKDESDYHQADMGEVHGKRGLKDMRSWRDLPCGFSYDPQTNTYFLPAKLGDFMLGQLPNDWALKAVRHLTMRTRERSGHGDLDIVFANVDKIRELLLNARWTDAYVSRVIDKNVVKMLDADGKVKPDTTPARRLAHFPGAHAVLEFHPNSDGALDLPDKDGTISDVGVPAGYLSGPGIITLAREASKPDSLWASAGAQARYVVDLFSELHHVAVAHLGSSDSLSASHQHPWYHSESPLAVLIDTYMDPEGPVFLGVPQGAARFTAEKSSAGATGGLARVDSSNVKDFLTALDTDDSVELNRTAITNRERALVLGGASSAYTVLLYPLGAVAGKFADAIADIVIEVSGYTRATITAQRLKNATLIANAAANANSDDARDAILAALSGAEKERKAFLADADRTYPGTTGNMTRANKLKAFEQTVDNVVVDSGTFTETREEEAARTRPAVWRGNYTRAPVTFLRAPLTSSDALRDYLRGRAFSYVLPADEAHFYELPEDLAAASEPRGMDMDADDDENTSSSSSTGGFGKLLQTAMRPLRSLLNASGARPMERPAAPYSDAASDLFAPLSVSSLLQMGARDSESAYTKKTRGRTAYDGDDDGDAFALAKSMHFRGPWKERRRYARYEITSASERFFFHLLMEAPNTAEAPLRLASLGAEIFGVMMVRPFIQAKTDALILTVAGPKTALYAFGHSTIQVSKEARGLFHLTCGFYHGVVRLNPDNMQLMLNAIPREFIGGKKVDFMTDRTHYGNPNPDKESILAFLIPVSERGTVASPMNVCNNETYQLEGEGNAIWERKCSAFGPFYDYAYRSHNPAKTDAMQYERTAYGQSVQAATVVHLGPTAYTNPQTMRKEDTEGVGPSGERVMNMPGAQLVWNGQSHRFPQKTQYDLTTI